MRRRGKIFGSAGELNRRSGLLAGGNRQGSPQGTQRAQRGWWILGGPVIGVVSRYPGWIAAGIGGSPSGMRMGWGHWPGGIVDSLLNHRAMALNPPGSRRLFGAERDPDGAR